MVTRILADLLILGFSTWAWWKLYKVVPLMKLAWMVHLRRPPARSVTVLAAVTAITLFAGVLSAAVGLSSLWSLIVAAAGR